MPLKQLKDSQRQPKQGQVFPDDGLQDEQEVVDDPYLELEDQHHSSSPSSSEYHDEVGKKNEDIKDNLEVIEIENNKLDTDIIIKTGDKKQKKGLMGRDQIWKIQSQSSNHDLEHVGQKRKGAQIQEYKSSFLFFTSQLISF